MDLDSIISSFFGSTENLWAYIKKYASTGTKEVTRIILQMYYCLMAPTTPSLDKVIIVAGLGYQLLPSDLLPRDKYKILGLLDNGITLALAYNKVKSNVTPEIANQVETILGQWFGVEETPSGPSRFSGRGECDGFPKEPTFPTVIPSNPGTAPKSDPFDDLIVD